MDEERYIGIIMTKKEVTEGVHIYFPDHITDGYLIGEEGEKEVLFEDMYSWEQYYLFNNPNSAFDTENVAGFVIKEKDLIEQNEGLSLSEAKQEYFDNSKELTLVGFYIYSQEKIEFLKLGIGDLFNYFNNLKLNNESPIKFASSEKLYELLLGSNDDLEGLKLEDGINSSVDSEEETQMISIPIKDMEQLLKMNSTEIKKTLQEMKKSYDKIMKYTDSFINNQDVIDSKEKALQKLDNVYKHILDMNDINSIKLVINEIIDMYTELVVSLDDDIQDEVIHDKATNMFYEKIDTYEELLKSNDIDEIKKKITEIKENQRKHIDTIEELDTSDYYKHKQKEKELNDVFNEKNNDEKEKGKLKFNPKDMKEFFDKRIIGQEEAKIDVISAVFMNSIMDDPINKNSCLLIGPTGSGKTLIAESVAKFLDLPFVSIDTTQLTSPGYVGADIEDFLSILITKADGDIEKAEHGIVLLDEIDKKGSESNSDVSGRGVLNTLLPFIQGTTYSVSDSSYGKKKVKFDTKNLTIFATGAFTDVNKYMGNSSIGFGAHVHEKEEDVKYKKITREDLKKHGNMPEELLGRFSTITQLSGHTKESLKTILTGSNISNLHSEKEKLEKLGISLSWTEDYLDKVAENALTLKTGARSLKSVIEESIKTARWEAINNIGEVEGIILNKDSVEDADKSVLVYKDGGTNTVEEIKNNKEISKVKSKQEDK